MNELEPGRRDVVLPTRRAAPLRWRARGERLALDFPSRPPQPAAAAARGSRAALGARRRCSSRRATAGRLRHGGGGARRCSPTSRGSRRSTASAVIATAPGRDVRLRVALLRAAGRRADEDPVTGSAHCTLMPVLGEAARQDEPARAPGLEARRRAVVRGPRRARLDRRPRRQVPGGRDRDLTMRAQGHR